jgi:hypothetical protein
MWFSPGAVDSPWINPDRIASWPDIMKATRPARGASGKSGPSSFFEVFTTEKHREVMDVSTLPKKKLMYVGTYFVKGKNVNYYLKLMGWDKYVVVVPDNRLAKFKRDYPKAPDFWTWARSQVKVDMNEFYSDKDRMAASIDYETKRVLGWIDTTRVNDPIFDELKTLSGTFQENPEANKHKNMAQFLRMSVVPINTGGSFQTFNLFDRYPLLDSHMSAAQKEDAYLYINTKWAKIKKESKK